MSRTDAPASSQPTLSPAGHLDALRTVEMLAGLLTHIERQMRPDPHQYRVVVTRLSAALEAVSMDATLRAILTAHPSAAEIYENVHYAHAGLCLHGLDRSLATEQAARRAMDKARKTQP